MTLANEAASVTIVIQTRPRPGQDEAFSHWEARVTAIVAAQPGFIDQSVIPPNPPTQPDWLILLRFDAMTAATAWLQSDRRRFLMAELQPLLVGVHDLHILRDPGPHTIPSPVSALVTMRVKPGRETEFRAWQERLVAAEVRYPGFRGYRFEQPLAGVEDDWIAILRFDTESNLQGWLNSPQRQALLKEAESFVADTHLRVARTGFEPWFAGRDGRMRMPAPWKQSMVVLLVLYPVVFLFGHFVQLPLLVGRAGLPYWGATFISNAISVLLLSLLIPWAGRRLGWWLRPRPQRRMRMNILGAALALGRYGLSLFIFSCLP